jgi:DNA-binding MarR family transcriptional regulator
MTARFDRLERAGMTERRPDPNDRRGKLIALTAQDRAIVDETLTKYVANEEKLIAALTPAEQERLNHLLKKLIAAL